MLSEDSLDGVGSRQENKKVNGCGGVKNYQDLCIRILSYSARRRNLMVNWLNMLQSSHSQDHMQHCSEMLSKSLDAKIAPTTRGQDAYKTHLSASENAADGSKVSSYFLAY